MKTDLQTEKSRLNASKAKDEKAEEQAEIKHDFPPPINSLFSFDLPALASKAADQNDSESKAPASMTASFHKKNVLLSSLETSAKNYLLQLKEDDEEELEEASTLKDMHVLLNPSVASTVSATQKKHDESSSAAAGAAASSSLIPRPSFFTSQPNIYRREEGGQDSELESNDQNQSGRKRSGPVEEKE